MSLPSMPELAANLVLATGADKSLTQASMSPSELNKYVGLRLFSSRAIAVPFSTSLNSDIGTITLPSGITRWVPLAVILSKPSGTLAVATFDLRTATGGGGTAIVSAGALTNVTGTGTFQSLPLAALTAALTATTLTVRQIAAALGAQTANIAVWGYDLSD